MKKNLLLIAGTETVRLRRFIKQLLEELMMFLQKLQVILQNLKLNLEELFLKKRAGFIKKLKKLVVGKTGQKKI
jgi:hypothetical protein